MKGGGLMDCAEIRQHLSEYLDNEAAPVLQRQIKEHLAACPQCRRQLAELHELSQALTALSEPLPDGLSARLADCLTQQRREQVSPRRTPLHKKALFKVASIAACLLLCLGAAGLAFEPGQDGAPTPDNSLPELAALDADSNGEKQLAPENKDIGLYGGSESADASIGAAPSDSDAANVAEDSEGTTFGEADAADTEDEPGENSAARSPVPFILLAAACLLVIFLLVWLLLQRKKDSKI